MSVIRLIIPIFTLVPVVLSADRFCKFQSVHGRDVASVKPTLGIATGRSKIDCITACLALTDCGGFNYKRLNSGIIFCGLKIGMSFGSRIQPEDGTIYYEKTGSFEVINI